MTKQKRAKKPAPLYFYPLTLFGIFMLMSLLSGFGEFEYIDTGATQLMIGMLVFTIFISIGNYLIFVTSRSRIAIAIVLLLFSAWIYAAADGEYDDAAAGIVDENCNGVVTCEEYLQRNAGDFYLNLSSELFGAFLVILLLREGTGVRMSILLFIAASVILIYSEQNMGTRMESFTLNLSTEVIGFLFIVLFFHRYRIRQEEQEKAKNTPEIIVDGQ